MSRKQPRTLNENEAWPDEAIPLDDADVVITASEGGSTTGHVGIEKNLHSHNRTNDWGPWVTLCGVLAGVALGFSLTNLLHQGQDLADVRADVRAQVAQTEARVNESTRDMGTKCQLLKNHVDELKSAVDVKVLLLKELKCR